MTDDTISRKAAIEAMRCLQTYKLCEGDEMLLVDVTDVLKELRKLPSAQPEPIKFHIDHALTEEEIKNLKQKIADSPTVLMPSAEPEIVRCKDCKYYMQSMCPITATWTTDEDFCSFGKRSDKDGTQD